MRRLLALLLPIYLLAGSAKAGPSDLPGPTPATAPLFAYVDARNGDAKLESLRDAIPWIMRNGDESALPVLEDCLADSSLLERDRKWILQLFTWGGPKPDSPMRCATFQLVERLLASDRLNARDWRITLDRFTGLVRDWRECASQRTLDIIVRAMAEPQFNADSEAMNLAGMLMLYAPEAACRVRAEAALWEAYERVDPQRSARQAHESQGGALIGYFVERASQQPETIDLQLLRQAERVVLARIDLGLDSEYYANVLLTCLRERPDLREQVDWPALRHSLLDAQPLSRLHEGNTVVLANLIPYAPQWVTKAFIDSLFAALVPKDVAYLTNPRSSVFGAIPDCIAACAVYGQGPEEAMATASRLLELALDPEGDDFPRIEVQAALATIYWHYPDIVDADLVDTLRPRGRSIYRGIGPFNAVRSDDLYQVALAVRPDLLTDADFPMIWDQVSYAGKLLAASLQRPLFVLARTGSDAIYCQILANVRAQMESPSLRPETARQLADFLGRLERIRRDPPGCE